MKNNILIFGCQCKRIVWRYFPKLCDLCPIEQKTLPGFSVWVLDVPLHAIPRSSWLCEQTDHHSTKKSTPMASTIIYSLFLRSRGEGNFQSVEACHLKSTTKCQSTMHCICLVVVSHNIKGIRLQIQTYFRVHEGSFIANWYRSSLYQQTTQKFLKINEENT